MSGRGRNAAIGACIGFATGLMLDGLNLASSHGDDFWLFVIGGAITGGVQLGIGALFGAVIGYLLGELVGTGAMSDNTRLIVGGAIVGAFIEHWYDNRGNGGAETAEDDQ